MNEVTKDSSFKEAEALAKPIKYLGLTFLAAIIANAIFIGLFGGSPLMYAALPFNLAFIFNVAWLAKVAYGSFIALMSVVLVVFPIGVFLIMLLALSRVLKRIKALGYKTGFTGNLVAVDLKNGDGVMIGKEDKFSQSEAQKPQSKSRTLFFIVAIIVGVMGLFIYSYISGLANGFANS